MRAVALVRPLRDLVTAVVTDRRNAWWSEPLGQLPRPGDGSVTELDARTGALVRILSGPRYRLDFPAAIAVHRRQRRRDARPRQRRRRTWHLLHQQLTVLGRRGMTPCTPMTTTIDRTPHGEPGRLDLRASPGRLTGRPCATERGF
jgi:hypothetical protein